MNSSTNLLIAVAIAVIVGLILFWWNPSALQDSTGEPNLVWIFVIAIIVVFIVYWIISANSRYW